MTTTVIVDAHAGWPVKVTQVCLDADGKAASDLVVIVAPHTKQTFYVHSSLDLIVHEEQPAGMLPAPSTP